MAISKLFNQEVTPSCEYCEFGVDSSDGTMVECHRKGLVSPYFRCSKFKYSPVRRKPQALPRLPQMKPEDFSL